jgi:hypothetical protein
VKDIRFYTTAAGRCPVQEHLDDLPDKTVQNAEIRLAEERKADYLTRRQGHG